MRFHPIPPEDVPRRISRALGHPIRVEALRCLIKDDTISANRIAKQIGENTGTVAYHVRVLFEECRVLELADVQPVRGALEHFFRLAPIAHDDDGLFMCRPATLDDRGLQDALEALREANEKMEKAEAESHQRLEKNGGEALTTLLSVTAIEASQLGSAVAML
jgi:DNA-binding transcriptional ArsR family regulator